MQVEFAVINRKTPFFRPNNDRCMYVGLCMYAAPLIVHHMSYGLPQYESEVWGKCGRLHAGNSFEQISF
jgi:hypothetical protein